MADWFFDRFMSAFSAIDGQPRSGAAVSTFAPMILLTIVFATAASAQPASSGESGAGKADPTPTLSQPPQNPLTTATVVLLLPLEQPMLRRAAAAVRDGVQAVYRSARGRITLRECGYGNDGVVAAYRRCVDERVDIAIGPLGRSDVSALLDAKLPVLRPTLLLSPTGRNPPEPFIVLAPDLESEADAIARQSLNDACRKPVLVEASGAIANRIATAITTFFRVEGPATQLSQFELGARDRWQRVTDGWRRDGVDCVLFAGGSATLFEFKPYLRNMAVYITSASYEAELDRTVDWSGVRIADSPLLLDPTRAEFASLPVPENLSPTLARLFLERTNAMTATHSKPSRVRFWNATASPWSQGTGSANKAKLIW
jgi:outer membrane PBP1 activator LpoA protein